MNRLAGALIIFLFVALLGVMTVLMLRTADQLRQPVIGHDPATTTRTTK